MGETNSTVYIVAAVCFTGMALVSVFRYPAHRKIAAGGAMLAAWAFVRAWAGGGAGVTLLSIVDVVLPFAGIALAIRGSREWARDRRPMAARD